MKAAPTPCRARAAIRAPTSGLSAHANGQIAVGAAYIGWPGQPQTLQVLQVITLEVNGRIAEITAFVGAELAPFGVHASG